MRILKRKIRRITFAVSNPQRVSSTGNVISKFKRKEIPFWTRFWLHFVVLFSFALCNDFSCLQPMKLNLLSTILFSFKMKFKRMHELIFHVWSIRIGNYLRLHFKISYHGGVWPRFHSFLWHNKSISVKNVPAVVIRDVCGTQNGLFMVTSICSMQKSTRNGLKKLGNKLAS